MDQANANFEGWALIELYGHGREAGYVTTQHFGAACMFQVDVPEVKARQEAICVPRWRGEQLLPVGTVVEFEAVPGRTRLLGVGSIYSMHPATEEAVREAITRAAPRELKVVSLPERAVLAAPSDEEDPDDLEGSEGF